VWWDTVIETGATRQGKKQIPFGNDRQRERGKDRSGSFSLLRMTRLRE